MAKSEFEGYMRGMARAIDQLLKEDFGELGFALLIFDFDDPGTSNYISNINREDMIKALRETADRLEKNQVIPAVDENTPIQ